MAISRPAKVKLKPRPRSVVLLAGIATAIALLLLLSSTSSKSNSFTRIISVKETAGGEEKEKTERETKYLYWGNRIDCPGKHCASCAGLGHQESSLRCALEEAIFLNRVFVMPSRMCLNAEHNKKGLLHQSVSTGSDERWEADSCAMDSLYDVELMSRTVPVILDNSKAWHRVLSMSMKLGKRGIAHIEGIGRNELKDDKIFQDVLLINRTANPLAWFMECKDRTNHSSALLPFSFLPTMATKKLRQAANKIKDSLGDYDGIHVRRGDILKTRKDRFGVERSVHPHADRDTRPEFIMKRIAKWIPPGRTIYIASNERTPGFFSPMSARYRLAYSSNFSDMLDPLVENNYHLFMVDRLVLLGAKKCIKTFKDNDDDLSLSDDPKKNTKNWQIPVYNDDR